MGLRRVVALATVLAGALYAHPAAAQSMNLGEIVLLWASGPYSAPAICQLPEGPRRVARNIRIKPPRSHRPREKHKLTIEPIGMGDARCMNELGEAELEIEGSAVLSFTGPNRPDTARRDFEHLLRRNNAFDLNLDSGQLSVGVGEDQTRVDLKGGNLRISRIAPGSDAARMLGDVGGLATRTLELSARDGTRFVFHAVYIVPRALPR